MSTTHKHCFLFCKKYLLLCFIHLVEKVCCNVGKETCAVMCSCASRFDIWQMSSSHCDKRGYRIHIYFSWQLCEFVRFHGFHFLKMQLVKFACLAADTQVSNLHIFNLTQLNSLASNIKHTMGVSLVASCIAKAVAGDIHSMQTWLSVT